MEQHLLIGLVGLVFLIGLIAIRMPIAYSMILVGGVGVPVDQVDRIRGSVLRFVVTRHQRIENLPPIGCCVHGSHLSPRSPCRDDQ